MLFNSYEFLFLFLPIALIGFYSLGNKEDKRRAISWLVVVSIFFYAWWNPAYLLLIGFSIAFNFLTGRLLSKTPSMSLLTLGVSGNVALLAYYKYANFFVDTFNEFLSRDIILAEIILPIAISFFTFQQIAYLVDTYRGDIQKANFLNYCLFVTFFPQLIAGPIVHHKEMLPQFIAKDFSIYRSSNLVIGLTIFFIGLFKKCVLADGIADYSTPVFSQAEQGIPITFFEGWGGSLAYTLQLYFDFSGYSDMAIGLGRMFGIMLPVNFLSPYKANNIISFWRQWHITLSRFLREYLYIPLGGSKNGPVKRYRNLIITMLLGGLWHGAGWNFLIWGALHAGYLVVNHMWRFLPSILDSRSGKLLLFSPIISRIITFTAIVFAWVVFRAETIEGAMFVYQGMLGMNGISIPVQMSSHLTSLQAVFPSLEIEASGLGSFGSPLGVLWIIGLMGLVWLAPNTTQFMEDSKTNLSIAQDDISLTPAINYNWRPSKGWSMVMALIATLSVLSFRQVSEFLYFQF